MEIHWNDGRLSLQSPDDFKSFKLVVHSASSLDQRMVQDFAGTARFESDLVCWVSQQGLLELAGPLATPQWQQSLAGMIAKAQPHGWVDAATGEIRAHVERR